jgi:hypothetical protein
MLLYKYRSIDDLWILLDMVINNRVWCANWETLNDPLEGRYEAHFDKNFIDQVDRKREEWRICSLSKSLKNFLLWSHYASGHKGVAVEIELPDNHAELEVVQYSPFTPIFTEIGQSNLDQKHLFTNKSLEWKYEEEYRIICKEQFFALPNPIRKIYLGPMISDERKSILRVAIPPEVEIVEMSLDRYQGWVVPKNA